MSRYLGFIGAAFDVSDPIAGAKARKADAVQFFLGNPQSWSSPELPYPDGPDALREAAQAAGIRLYVHAPFIINVASTNNKVRIPSRSLLSKTLKLASLIGAEGVIVHGGHVAEGEDPAVGVANWGKALAQVESDVPVLIENTAGGDRAMARRLDSITRLFEVATKYGAGFCLDTCHAHAGGLNMETLVRDIMGATGRIDLIHANGSRDTADSGRDRHANLANNDQFENLLDAKLVARIIYEAKAPAIVETPGDENAQAADIAFLRAQLAAVAGE
ncbi:putative endonuclease 4 [mine drainage metagenome]|uniref:Putative endonuclease 4 n=1 Tax=mine drainage metagenome TaxID=410659 RepID=A0A1J5Q2Z8_9ZZZZ